MKAITTEKVVKEIIGYEAADGTRFATEGECKKYEESYKYILKQRFMELVVGLTTEYGLFGVGNDDVDLYVLTPKTQKDIDYIRQYVGTIDHYAPAKITDDLIGDELVIGIGYDEWVSVYGTVETLHKGITAGIAYAKDYYNDLKKERETTNEANHA